MNPVLLVLCFPTPLIEYRTNAPYRSLFGCTCHYFTLCSAWPEGYRAASSSSWSLCVAAHWKWTKSNCHRCYYYLPIYLPICYWTAQISSVRSFLGAWNGIVANFTTFEVTIWLPTLLSAIYGTVSDVFFVT